MTSSSDSDLAVLSESSYWRACRSSALIGLLYNNVKLKQYATYLKQGISVQYRDSKRYNFAVTVEVDDKLKLDDSQPNALVIQVHARITDEQPSSTKLVYRGIFMSWGGTRVTNLPNSIHLPLYFDFGSPAIASIIRNSLTKLFSCSISDFKIEQEYLVLILKSAAVKINSSKNMKLIYNNVLNGNSLKTELLIADDVFLNIWKELTNNDDTNSQEAVFKTYIRYLKAICISTKIDATRLCLTEVSFRRGYVRRDGQVSLRNAMLVPAILDMLTELLNK